MWVKFTRYENVDEKANLTNVRCFQQGKYVPSFSSFPGFLSVIYITAVTSLCEVNPMKHRPYPTQDLLLWSVTAALMYQHWNDKDIYYINS